MIGLWGDAVRKECWEIKVERPVCVADTFCMLLAKAMLNQEADGHH